MFCTMIVEDESKFCSHVKFCDVLKTATVTGLPSEDGGP